jgi:N-methylhydantoinase A/oxoprolinase/acetone carboxylase beta subunit
MNASGRAPAAPAATRTRFDGVWHATTVLDRFALGSGSRVPGPARIDHADTTTLIPPGWNARVEPSGHIDIRRAEDAR